MVPDVWISYNQGLCVYIGWSDVAIFVIFEIWHIAADPDKIFFIQLK